MVVFAHMKPNERHVMSDSAYFKEWRADHLSRGLCSCCNELKLEDSVFCQKHYENARIRDFNKKEKLKLHGICYACGKNPIVEGRRKCLHCLEKHRERNVQDRLKIKHSNICKKCGLSKESCHSLCPDCLEKANERHAEKRLEMKMNIIKEYGGKCQCCGEHRPAFLSIDHVNNDGKQHREAMGNGGLRIYLWLKKHGYPKDGFELLCHNCNHGRYINGGICPHKEKSKTCLTVTDSLDSKISLEPVGKL